MTTSHTIILGRLGRNPEIRAAGGKNVCNFSLAVNDGTKTNPHTSWYNCTAWEKTGDMIAQYVSKGDLLYVSRQMRSRSYTDKQGNDREAWDLTVRDFTLLPRGEKASEPTREARAPASDEDVAF